MPCLNLVYTFLIENEIFLFDDCWNYTVFVSQNSGAHSDMFFTTK